MAALYFSEQLVATSDIPGVLSNQLIDKEIIITYEHFKNKYYTIIIYDEEQVHSLTINIKGENIESGDVLVDYVYFQYKPKNYNALIYIYEQLGKIPLPKKDFDMIKFIHHYNLKLLYRIEFMILQKLEKKPNIFSPRSFYTKLREYKK